MISSSYRIRNFLALLLVSIFGTTLKTSSQIVAPAPYSSNPKINFVRTWTTTAPEKNCNDLMSRPTKDVQQVTEYIDGLGRTLQTVVKKGSLVTGDTAKDLVVPIVYDDLGREQYKYLPFVANTTGSNTSISDGLFKLNPFQQDSAFNKGMFSDESYYYGKTVFEASPLNRVLETYAPGNNWVGSASQTSEVDRHGKKQKYWINTASDSVRVWAVTDVSNGFGTYASASIYSAGILYKNVSLDEHNKQVIEFKDKEGKTILKKMQLTADADTGTGKNHTGWLCTYYIYDDQGQLRAVIQPQAVELLAAGSWSMNSTILDELCFRYEYDIKERMIMKKVPGAGTVFMIYDARDRLVMTQDSAMRAAHKWLYTIYDALNRPTITGLITDNTYYNDAAYHRSHADTSIAWPVLASYTDEQLTKTFYDDYSWRSSEGNPLSATRNTSYDTYLLTASNTTWPYPQDATLQSNQLNGVVTGFKTKILGTSTYLYSVNFYDDQGRVIQTQSQNISGGTDISVTQYSWSGQPLLTITKHEKAGTNPQTSIALTKLSYDDLWRISKTEKKISTTKVNSGSMPGSWTTINQNEYDALGLLSKKKIGTTPIDSLQYDYNIRGLILGMNRTYVKDTTSTNHWFGFDLGYDKTAITVNGTTHSYATAQYNGNINGMLWRSTGDDMLRKYDFTYDAAMRLLSADFKQLNSNSFSKAAKIDFSVNNMNYDANGNIQRMDQKGWKLGGSITIDSLLYGYVSNSNKLSYVNDRTNDSASYLGDFKEYTNNTSQDYSYESNGNLTKDANKRIDTIFYNHLNLADSIVVTGKGNIKYTYDASGNKIKKTTREGAVTTSTLYLMGNYINDTLQFISTEEGRARIKSDSSAVVYDYMIKDHLGNVRMVLTEETRTDSYPAATMETASATTEENFYNNLSVTRENPPVDYPSNTPPGNAKVAKVNGGGNMIGPAIVLKVMAGDKFSVTVNSWWKSNNSPSNTGNPLSGLLTAIGNSTGGVNGGHPSVSDIQGSTELSTSITSFLNDQGYTSGPKAYLNWILLDERFNYVVSSSGFQQVEGSNNYSTLGTANEPIDKNGYLYIYVSNITDNIDVFFDNLQVTHIRGQLAEENHYYPFGLMQQGICSKALAFGGAINKKGYAGNEIQNREFSDGSGLELYDFNARTYDHQIGRFIQIDPLTEEGGQESWSPYHYSYNNPITFSDPDGKFPILLPLLIPLITGTATVSTGTLVTTAAIGVAAIGTAAAVKNSDISFSEAMASSRGSIATSAYLDLKAGMDRVGNTSPKTTTTPATSAQNNSVWQRFAGQKGKSPVMNGISKAVKKEETGSIYLVPGERTRSGKPYGGRTKHSDPAKRGSSDGRERRTEDKVDSYDPKKVMEGRKKEQKLIDKHGLENMDNKRNEIKPKKNKT